MKFPLETKIYAGYGIAVIIMLLIGVAVRRISARLEDSMQGADHTREVLSALDEANSSVLEMQTGFRGYLIKVQTNFVDAYQSGADHLRDSLEELRTLTLD